MKSICIVNYGLGNIASLYNTTENSLRVKKILNLPSDAEITMIISCGIREVKGVYGAQFRVPFKQVYFEL